MPNSTFNSTPTWASTQPWFHQSWGSSWGLMFEQNLFFANSYLNLTTTSAVTSSSPFISWGVTDRHGCHLHLYHHHLTTTTTAHHPITTTTITSVWPPITPHPKTWQGLQDWGLVSRYVSFKKVFCYTNGLFTILERWWRRTSTVRRAVPTPTPPLPPPPPPYSCHPHHQHHRRQQWHYMNSTST